MNMEEPSVLDYLKSKLKFWKRGEKIQIPMPEPTAPAPQPDGSTSSLQGLQPAAPARAFAWPWRSLLALGLALTGQLLFEPPGQAAFAGTVLYVFGAALLIWATLRGEWTLIDLPISESRNDPLTFRRLPMILAIIFTIVAFIVLNDNMFTWYNVTLWVAAIVCYVWALWV